MSCTNQLPRADKNVRCNSSSYLKTLVTCNVFTQMKGYASKQYYVYILCYFTLLCTNLSKCNFDFVMKLNNTFLACILKLFLIDSANHIDILQIAYNIYMYLYT